MFTVAQVDDTWDLIEWYGPFPSKEACEDFIKGIKEPGTRFNIVDDENEIVKRLVF